MSRILAELLGVNQPLFDMEIGQLEQAAGLPSHDVRLTAEIISKVQLKARQLGLDPRDTTGQEMYAALLSLVRLHDDFLARRLGADDPADVPEVLKRVRLAALKADVPRSCWVLKASVAKRLLKAHPPKKVMKYLGYKSLDSLLKREPIGELFAGMLMLESQAWLEGLLASYENLSQMDFEVRDVAIIQLSDKRWGKAAKAFALKRRHIILTIRELGVVAILPPPFKRRAGMTIAVLMLLLHQLSEIRLYSAFYKLHQMRPDLGRIMARSLLHDEGNHLDIGGQRFHWRVAQRHFGRVNYHPEALEPHVQADDLSWRKAEEVLYRLEPALHFWHDFDHVGALKDGQPLSFNLMDNALNSLNHVPYDQRLSRHMRDSLWNELFGRYMAEPMLEAAALRQLDDAVVADDFMLLDLGLEVA